MFKCPTCRKSFRSKEYLQQHVLDSPAHPKLDVVNQHKGVHHRCQFCAYTSEAPFCQWGAEHYLITHARKVCKRCIPDSFESNGQYLNHMREKHHGYYCIMCDEVFAQPFLLKKDWKDPKHPSQCKSCMSDVQSADRASHQSHCVAWSRTELTVPGPVMDTPPLQQSSHIPRTSSEKTALASDFAHSPTSLQTDDISGSMKATAALMERQPNQFRSSSLNWIENHRKELYVQVAESDYRDRKKCKTYIDGMKIYQSLTIYTIFHLQHCVKSEKSQRSLDH
ncbi:hypothetical protein BJ138DRAFT_509688 [Hygrophoropsis aurantiaca]|uniref:Uncharacterized protein n=1 Tax=Hygrophoropsis aurantiaca TaxID=72124 RepID=A0ACB8A2Z9_9AGAM|nr:hypothetical protein BJ138DRAFT_509688 [Hygrophoropsis aurantiaca]